MAKGVDPSVGRDVGDMLPDENEGRNNFLFRCLLAILIGNTLYFVSSPLLPAAARMQLGTNFRLPALVDLWYCVFVFGVLNLAAFIGKRNKPRR